MSWRDDLALFGIELPEKLPIDDWAASLAGSPCKNTLTLVGLATVVFYAAEKGRNPKVKDIWDSLVYCSTCISVGYADIFARTPVGKILGSALMTLGPAMAARTVDGPRVERRDANQEQMVALLKGILEELQAARQASARPLPASSPAPAPTQE